MNPTTKIDTARSGIALAEVIALAAVATDLGFAAIHRDVFHERLVLGLVPLLGLWWASGRSWASLGLARPLQSSGYWIKVCVVLAFLGGVAAVIGLVFQDSLAQQEMVWKFKSWTVARAWMLQMGLRYPLIEELIYRGLFCTVLLRKIGFWPTVMANGAVFGVFHFLWGVAEPINIVAGFLLSWAFLKSRSLYVPFLLHSLGNIAAGLTHLPPR